MSTDIACIFAKHAALNFDQPKYKLTVHDSSCRASVRFALPQRGQLQSADRRHFRCDKQTESAARGIAIRRYFSAINQQHLPLLIESLAIANAAK
jgi:hypothetical protein